MTDPYHIDAYDYYLPAERIAQAPAERREEARLLVLDLPDDTVHHRYFNSLTDLLRPDDLLVVNDTRVFPARLLGRKATGGRVELLLLHFPRPIPATQGDPAWQEATVLALLKSSRRPRPGSMVYFGECLTARIDGYEQNGKARAVLCYRATHSLEEILEQYGQVPLPPYIQRPDGSTAADRRRYQTRYARQTGSVAAPTAGLHFSDGLLRKIESMGIGTVAVTLHVGYGTFAPVRSQDIRKHRIHEEYVRIPPATAAAVNRTKKKGGRIWAVGTTSARTLEFAAGKDGFIQPLEKMCDLYIYPGYRFKVVDNMITNFHLPRSSLLFLVSALAGRERILATYKEAVHLGYRFFSYGDAMAIVTR